MSQFEVVMMQGGEATALTPFVSNLSFRSVDPGGFGSASFDLARSVDGESFQDFATINVYDAETGEQVGGGRLLNPGRGTSANGEVWKVSVLGEGVAHLQERKNPYWLIDSRLDQWRTGKSTSVNRRWEYGEAPAASDESGESGLVFSIQQENVGQNAYTNADYYHPREFEGQYIGGFNCVYTCGKNSSNSHFEMAIRPTTSATQLDLVNESWSTGTRTRLRAVTTDWSSAIHYARANFVFARLNSDLIGANDTDFILVKNADVSAIRYKRDGTENVVGADYKTRYVLAHDAIVDALVRWCPRIDVATARIDTTTEQHKNLVWNDGITTYDMLTFLMEHEPEFTWAVWEQLPTGKWRFEWRARDTNVRYELGDASSLEFELTGGEDQHLATIWYTGEGLPNQYLTFRLEASNPFADLNIVPTDTRQITVNDGGDWTEAAEAEAEAAIEGSKLKATSAQATVGRMVYDHYTGRWIKPYLMRPGYLCRITSVRSQLDTLNLRENDLAAVFRIVSMDYSVDQGTARLDLNSYTVDEARAIADLLNAAA